MKKVLFLLALLPFSIMAQRTFTPDDAFEQALINLDLDDMLDDSVTTSSIDTVQMLFIPNLGITDMTGIEDFTALTDLFCYDNQLQFLDLSNNPNLYEVNCRSNQLTSLSVKNGNPTGLWYFRADDNPDLLCVEVDNVPLAQYSWIIDITAVFSTNCSTSSISEIDSQRRLIKIVDVSGRDVLRPTNQPVFYMYSDGTVEKRVVIE